MAISPKARAPAWRKRSRAASPSGAERASATDKESAKDHGGRFLGKPCLDDQPPSWILRASCFLVSMAIRLSERCSRTIFSPAGLIDHSDRGSQYCSDAYRKLAHSARLYPLHERPRQLLRQCHGRDRVQDHQIRADLAPRRSRPQQWCSSAVVSRSLSAPSTAP